ncbi:FecCD family ABC transporter permease [Segnochrobactrum spirostomi]|uniref:Iron ABC transporter permease n=1 Tax=Segnochrobactrum spirostomi TaxID=2608987 RepID=A0A6A7Y813_9HYPH|nr:iron chelate uptake ABC transporter family permease subunit [Segnochrobactrum spirostomi]MQT13802.1 iron ABC transporter permease [Segnochrobactrum spirostomi]
MTSATTRDVTATRPLGDRTGRGRLTLAGAALVLVAAAVLSLALGPTGISLDAVPRVVRALLAGGTASPEIARERLVLVDIRLTRTVLGILVGASLGITGAMMQGLFRNPLADPGLVGASTGAGLAAVAMIALGGGALAPVVALLGTEAVPVAAVIGAFATTLLLYAIATRQRQTSTATLLLAGVAIGAFAGALTGLIVFGADDRQLRDITFWTLGSLGGAAWPKLAAALPFFAVALAAAPLLARPLNALLLGEAEAVHLGIATEQAKRLAIAAAACAVGASVALSGVIGFVGIVVPHVVRLAAGPDHRIVLPGSALAGAALLLLADTIARVVVAPAELPIGIVTAAIGAPFFLWLLLRQRSGIV